MGQPEAVRVRDAATVILVRRDGPQVRVLMGQRGSAAAFMPDMFVFPGGAVERADLDLEHAPQPGDHDRLAVDTAPEIVRALPLAAIRELWEETGLRLGRADGAATARATAAPAAWRGFLEGGLAAHTGALRFVFRAVTPPGRPRRFDARFFLAEASDLSDDPMGFVAADHELRALQWIDLAAARALPLPFITGVVISEVEALLAEPGARRPVPYFRHDHAGSHFRML